jgi:crotonobetainyl-CoA:carnitine CoA-transferase CaiB-like acyl-CoA transferase
LSLPDYGADSESLAAEAGLDANAIAALKERGAI